MEVTPEAIKRMSDDEWQQLMASIGFRDLNLKKDNLSAFVINVAIKKREVRERIDKLAREKAARERPTPPPPTRPATPEQKGIAKIREEREHRRMRMLIEIAKNREKLEQRPPSENPAALIERKEKEEALARVDALLEAERLLAPHAEARRPQEQPLQAGYAECCVCLEKFRRPDLLALVPCGHRCVCAKCEPHLNQCPMCRTPIGGSLKVFDP